MSPQTSSADVIANNYDLLTLILLRLPLKSLLEFKSVSKHWLSVIADPHFLSRRNPNPTSGIFLCRSSYLFDRQIYYFSLEHDKSIRAPFRSFSFFNDSPRFKILQSCNGLLCCCGYRTNARTLEYYVCNPTTKQYTTLRKLSGFPIVSGVGLAFDPSKSPHYKVICVRNCVLSLDRNRYQIEIYSSETDSWRVSGDSFTTHFVFAFSGGVFWNGVIHWIRFGGNSLCFDIGEERLREMPMPPIPDGLNERSIRYFGESRGHLHLVETYASRTPLSTQFNVYEMGRDYCGWFVKYRVDLDAVTTAFPEMMQSYAIAVLCVVRGETEEDSFLVLHIPCKAIRYNLSSRNFEKLCDFDPILAMSVDIAVGYLRFEWSDAYQYIQSLSCV